MRIVVKEVTELYDFGRKRIYTVKEEGELFGRDENGNLFKSYKRYIHGDFKEYNRDGNLVHTSTYIEGKPHGKYRGYHPDGSLWYELDYIDGILLEEN